MYTELTPTVVVLWVVEPLFRKSKKFHSVFELRERETGELLSDQLSVHVLELSLLAKSLEGTSSKHIGEEERDVLRWGRFLTAKNPEELDRLAQEDETMRTAVNALSTLSEDKEAQFLARERADALALYKIELRGERNEGRKAGIEEGHRTRVQKLLVRRFGILPVWAEARLSGATMAELDAICDGIFDATSLEQVLGAAPEH